MRLSFSIILIIGVTVVFLIMLGMRSDTLPFIPDAEFSDAVISHWPAALFLRQSILEHKIFPLWRETLMAGQPFAANPLNKTAYPLQWLVLLLPPILHLNIMIVLHLTIAGFGMGKWVRSLGLAKESAILSSVAYAFAPKIIAHLGAGHLDLLYAMAWWPWLMWAIWRTGQPDSNRVRNICLLGIFSGLLFLADVRLSLFALSVAAAYGFWNIIHSRAWKKILGYMPAVVLFLLLTVSVIAPLMGWRPYLSRADMTLKDAGVYSLEAIHFIGLILPPHTGEFETLTYLGLPILILAIIALLSDFRKHSFWFVLLVLSILYALGINSPLWRLLADLIPGLLWFRVPSRAWFVLVLVVPLLAGYGLAQLMHVIEKLRAEEEIRLLVVRRLAIAGLMGASLTCALISLYLLNKPPLEFPPEVGIGVVIGGVSCGIILLIAYYGVLQPQWIARLLIIVTLADLAWMGHSWLEWRSPNLWLEPYNQLAQTLQAENPARIYSPSYSVPQQVAVAHGLYLFGGVDPFQLIGVNRAIAEGGGISSQAYSVVQPPIIGVEKDTASEIIPAVALDTKILAEWDVSHLVSAYPLENPRLQPVSQINETYIYANRDYSPDDLLAWPEGWSGLPDADEIARLNDITLLSAFISVVAFVVSLIVLLITTRNWLNSRF